MEDIFNLSCIGFDSVMLIDKFCDIIDVRVDYIIMTCEIWCNLKMVEVGI